MRRLPEWLRRGIPGGSTLRTDHILREHKLNTVCESALCPNRMECYSQRTATFMILGEICTRRCGFCAISVGKPTQAEEDEPLRVAGAALKLGLKHVVVTSVARDDLKDEGAGAFYHTVTEIKKLLPESTIEVLTPDFHARPELIERVASSEPDVYNHNLETVERLTPKVRPQARYDRSLKVLRMVKELGRNIHTKSGLMVGLGEKEDEVLKAMSDLRSVDCDILTIGQYLKPTEGKLEMEAFISPDVFSYYEREGEKLGFREVYSGPYVRSSYHAGEAYERSIAHAV